MLNISQVGLLGFTTKYKIMSGEGPRDEFEQLSDKDYLNQLLDSNHLQIYKKENILFLPYTFISSFYFVIFIMIFSLMALLYFFFELIEGSISKDTVSMLSDILEFSVFVATVVPFLLMIDLIFTTPGMIRRIKHNKMAEDFINGNRVSLENPRWINKIGYVNKLHPVHENEGQEIKFNPLKISENECYFVRHMRCIRHDNREGSYTTTHWETDAYGERIEVSHTTYYYYQVATFELNGNTISLKNSDYSPAFDTSITYDIVFEINDFDKSNGLYNGKILNLFVQDGSALDTSGERGGTVPDSPQRMKKPTYIKAAIA